jgi:glycosyltransferase involved in cell wall biosynthesis
MLVDLGAGYGGSMVYMESLQNLLGDDVSFAGLCVNPEAARYLRDLGIPVCSIAFTRKLGKVSQIAMSMAVLPYLRFHYRIDAIWVQGITDVLLFPLAKLLGCKTIVTRHLTTDIGCRTWFETLKRRAAELIYRPLLCLADRVFCVSETVAQDLELQNIFSSRTVTIPNWVSVTHGPAKDSRSEKRPIRLLFVGRLKKYKGASLILQAMRRLGTGNASLTIVGEGDFKENLERQAQGLPVKFAGFQKDTSSFYQETDLFINPTLGPEGLPLVSLEAMSYGIPCVLSDLPVHKEITNCGRTAVLFHCGDANDLCAKITLFLERPRLLESYGQAGADAVATKYSASGARVGYLEALNILF